MGDKFHFKRRGGHARLRSVVFKRDGFACADCARCALVDGRVELEGVGWADADDYDGRLLVWVGRDYLTLDHVVPRLLGGTDDESNLRTLCQPCNSRKGARAA